MHVVHLSCVAPPQTGGIGAVAHKEVELLNARGVQAELLAPGRVPTAWKFGNASALEFHRIMETLQSADVVHLHYPFYGTAGHIATLRRNGVIKKLVMTLHMDATAPGLRGLAFNLHRQMFQPHVLNAADALLVSSRDYAQHSSFVPWEEKVIELPFGVDETVFYPAAQTHRADSKRVLFVGGMDTAHAFKGVEVLLAALAKLPSDVMATFVGDGNLRPSFEAHATQLGLGSRVLFTGKLSEADLADAYRNADVFAFPSTSGAEAFGLVALEAQASGVPVVASELPGVRTVVKEGETGFLVPPRDVNALAEKLGYLLASPDLCAEMGKMARERILDRFTWTKHIDGLIGVYQKLV